MNPAKAFLTKTTPKPKTIRRARQIGIPDRILSLLSVGPMRVGELQKKGHFIGSALHKNIHKLKAAGVIVSHKDGGSVTLSVRGKNEAAGRSRPIEGELVTEMTAPKRAGPVSIASRTLGPALDEALSAVAHRLHPLRGAEEKLIVLDQLSRTLPPSIAKVLHAVMEDLVRFSQIGG